jgi:hypothetical protein
LRELEQAILRQDESLRRRRDTTVPTAEPVPTHSRLVASAVLVVVAAIGIATAYFVFRSNSDDEAALRTFVVKVENVLLQARDGRAAVRHAVDGALRCTIPLKQAAAEIEDVTANRNSLLQQIAALNVPDDARAQRAASLLQQAAAASFAADVQYRRDILRSDGCPPKVGAAVGERAGRLKRAFVATFNPLAARFGLATWSRDDF